MDSEGDAKTEFSRIVKSDGNTVYHSQDMEAT